MAERLLYKYLDAQGAAAMLYNGNLQFTNATRLNDPFDCHPGLIDFSKISAEQAKPWGVEDTILLKSDPYRRDRERAWICSLSKVGNSLPMWTFYAKNHTGVCIGLDIEKVKPHIHYMLGAMVFNDCWDVQYRDVVKKPDFFAKDNQDFFMYQLLTKAKDWEYEQEVRMFIFDPHQMCMDMSLPYKPKKNEVTNWKEVRAYPKISDDCFAAIYLGINIDEKHKKKIIKYAKQRNPDIKVYQMRINPNALRLDFSE
ncbi:MAG: DUF2971 domain-containing protein [Alistipes sp.]|jgi:hypothetical protein|nr:DUF2971 domain-containing protein [Alistipes sp.]